MTTKHQEQDECTKDLAGCKLNTAIENSIALLKVKSNRNKGFNDQVIEDIAVELLQLMKKCYEITEIELLSKFTEIFVILHRRVKEGEGGQKFRSEFDLYSLVSRLSRRHGLKGKTIKILLDWTNNSLIEIRSKKGKHSFLLPSLVIRLANAVELATDSKLRWIRIYTSASPIRLFRGKTSFWFKPVSPYFAEKEMTSKEFFELVKIPTIKNEVIENDSPNGYFYGKGWEGDPEGELKWTKVLVSPHLNSVPALDYNQRTWQNIFDAIRNPERLTKSKIQKYRRLRKELSYQFGKIMFFSYVWGRDDITQNQNIAFLKGKPVLYQLDHEFTYGPMDNESFAGSLMTALNCLYFISDFNSFIKGFNEGRQLFYELLHTEEGYRKIDNLFKRRMDVEKTGPEFIERLQGGFYRDLKKDRVTEDSVKEVLSLTNPKWLGEINCSMINIWSCPITNEHYRSIPAYNPVITRQT
ncbi:MAG: hypothetical protein ACFFD4_27085 [Candidatus Odinarchaeota archaeon]